MKPVECQFEAEVLAAVCQSRWPERVDASLRDHAAGCEICRDLATVASAFDGAYEELAAEAVVPDAGRIWRLSQMRARREAVQAAGRPITAAQVIAFACAMGLLGACFGATSTWFQGTLGRFTAGVTGLDAARLLSSAATLLLDHAAFLVTLVALVFLVPAAFFFVIRRD